MFNYSNLRSGVSILCLSQVHGRSREQRYTKKADWQYIEQCAQLGAPVPVFGNGDILSYEDYEQALINSPSIAGIMIGRGALIKPWIFTEVKEQRHWDISSSDRLDILKRYVNYGLEHWGSDTKVTETLLHLHLINFSLFLILICFYSWGTQ
jgi:tRNA-dihydrouridine synthase 3